MDDGPVRAKRPDRPPLVKDDAAQRGVAVDEAKAIAASKPAPDLIGGRALARTRTRQVEESAA